MTHSEAGNVVVGLGVGAGSALVHIMGAEPAVIAAALASCVLGMPYAQPTASRWRAVAVFLASVLVTCQAAGFAAVVIVYSVPWLAPHLPRVQGVAAIVTGVGLHVLVSHVPEIVGRLMNRIGVRAQ